MISNPYYEIKDQIYGQLWNDYQVDSLHAYGDYDEASMFSYAAALVVESFYKHVVGKGKKVIYHGNEWMTGLGVLYVNKNLAMRLLLSLQHMLQVSVAVLPVIINLFMIIFLPIMVIRWLSELNMQSKHSIEKADGKVC